MELDKKHDLNILNARGVNGEICFDQGNIRASKISRQIKGGI